MKSDITAIILTKNEEDNIKKSICSLKSWVKRVVVVDSGSTDKTIEFVRELGVEVYHHEPFENHGKQFNWAIDNVGIDTKWIFRLDADEVVPDELQKEIVSACIKHSDDEVNAFEMRFKIYFMGRFLKHGGAYPFCKINIFKKEKARFNERPLGDNVELLSGIYLQLKNDCLHYDFKNLTAFINKHIWYADLEVVSYEKKLDRTPANISFYANLRKKIRGQIYYKLPRYFRAKLFYWFTYYFRLGFLDGEAGKIWAFLQTYFYRFVVDAKIYESELRQCGKIKNKE